MEERKNLGERKRPKRISDEKGWHLQLEALRRDVSEVWAPVVEGAVIQSS